MPIDEIKYEDKDGFHYRHPERSCNRCLNYPCIPSMNKLYGDYAKYGCKMFKDINTFDVCKPKR